MLWLSLDSALAVFFISKTKGSPVLLSFDFILRNFDNILTRRVLLHLITWIPWSLLLDFCLAWETCTLTIPHLLILQLDHACLGLDHLLNPCSSSRRKIIAAYYEVVDINLNISLRYLSRWCILSYFMSWLITFNLLLLRLGINDSYLSLCDTCDISTTHCLALILLLLDLLSINTMRSKRFYLCKTLSWSTFCWFDKVPRNHKSLLIVWGCPWIRFRRSASTMMIILSILMLHLSNLRFCLRRARFQGFISVDLLIPATFLLNYRMIACLIFFTNIFVNLDICEVIICFNRFFPIFFLVKHIRSRLDDTLVICLWSSVNPR